MPSDAPVHVSIWSDAACPCCNGARGRAAWLRERGAVVEWRMNAEAVEQALAQAVSMRGVDAAAG